MKSTYLIKCVEWWYLNTFLRYRNKGQYLFYYHVTLNSILIMLFLWLGLDIFPRCLMEFPEITGPCTLCHNSLLNGILFSALKWFPFKNIDATNVWRTLMPLQLVYDEQDDREFNVWFDYTLVLSVYNIKPL